MLIFRWLGALGPTNPIAVRLVQNGSKRARHLYVRSAYLAILIVVLLWALMLGTGGGDLDYRALAQAGATTFTWVGYLQIALICVLAPVFMAGAIAQEASPENWDVTLTTPLTPVQVVLGHLLGRLFFVIALLAASLPLFAMTQYFGGVPGSSIVASTLIAAGAATLVGAVAVALSVSRIAGKRAVFTFYVGVVSYLAVTVAIDVIIQRGRGAGVTAMTPINPFLALRALLNPVGYPRAEGPWALANPVTAWIVLSMGASAVLAGLSGFTVRSGGLPSVLGRSAGIPWYRRMLGLGGAGAEHRPPRTVWKNPIAWREATARNATLLRILLRWSFVLAGVVWAVAIVTMFHAGSFTAEGFRLAVLATVWSELLVVTLVAINMSATAITREREDGTLDLLLTTPIQGADYLGGKLRGLIAYLLPLALVPVVTLMLAGGYALATGATVREFVGTTQIDVPVVLPDALWLAPVAILPFVAMVVMLGLSSSLRSRGTIGSTVGTVLLVGAIGGVTGACGWIGGANAIGFGALLSGLTPATAIFAQADPAAAMSATLGERSIGAARGWHSVGVVLGALSWIVVVWGTRLTLVRSFDQIVRKLSGTR